MTPDTTELAKKIENLDAKFEGKFEHMEEAFTSFRHDLRRDITPLFKFMYEQEGYAKGVAESKAGSNLTLSRDVVKIIGILAAIIASLLGVNVLS